MSRSSICLALSALAIVACSSHEPEDHSQHDAGSTDSGQPEETGTAADGGTKTGKPATPQLVSVVKMGGALHVTWKLNDSALSAVALLRNKDGGTFEKTTLPGTATSQHDTSASSSGTAYCYKVVTTRAGIDSDESNETCGTP